MEKNKNIGEREATEKDAAKFEFFFFLENH